MVGTRLFGTMPWPIESAISIMVVIIGPLALIVRYSAVSIPTIPPPMIATLPPGIDTFSDKTSCALMLSLAAKPGR